MRFLARREHTRAELARKLASRAQEGEDVERVLDELARKGWLSDARFAEQAARAKSRRFGPIKLAHYLRSRGVGEEAITAGLQRAGAEVLFAPGLPSLEAVRTVCGALQKPFNFMVGIPGKSWPLAELEAAGVRRVSLATSLYKAAITGLVAAAREIREKGSFAYVDQAISSKELGGYMRH